MRNDGPLYKPTKRAMSTRAAPAANAQRIQVNCDGLKLNRGRTAMMAMTSSPMRTIVLEILVLFSRLAMMLKGYR